jgi:rhamnulokinase
MSQAAKFIAFDLGAESGRAMLAAFDGERITLTEALRFTNVPVRVVNGLHWDVLRLFDDIKRGLAQVAKEQRASIAAIGLDTWGVDLALLGRDDELLGNPFHYRDGRTTGMLEEAFRRVPREEIFQRTGIQFMQINTLYQMLAMSVRRAPALEHATTFLMIPDLFNFWLTGRKVCEFTIATTTQFYDPRERAWSRALFEAFGLPSHILPEIVPPGTVLGPLLASVVEEVGLEPVPVVAPACHDTGSAVAAVPAVERDYVWISSGTWSVLGAEVPQPVINAESLAYNFTNEGGVGGTYRLSKNVTGLWLVQECRRTWARAGEDLSYDTLVELARRAPPFRSLVDPDDDAFLSPGDMPARFGEYCRRTNQPVPEDKGAVIRCALESLACKYRHQIERLEALLGKPLPTIHIIGGGTRNKLLCQFTADATGRRVIAGPVEATALGNVMMQALALGHLGSLAEGRQVIGQSFELSAYEPRERSAWDEAYGRFVGLVKT